MSRLFIVGQLEPGGSGLESGAYLPVWLQAVQLGWAGNCRVGQMCWARQVVVKVYGSHDDAAGAKPDASPVDRTTVNMGTVRGRSLCGDRCVACRKVADGAEPS